ncbi:hypothetical protein BO78DRAFT_161152 [Aspergillus sclerotiicarbonarius CBS 121057]|uniref:Uncharacterized protein n=1 Tax=Aspergillus sclerotiicarbonarius (strain CBS 121057 / IBT 28362) TaxID=1448318 RepID=A0A319FMU4_ASPSB|nr:hypothetical protein BO78DRAFT_161152 [Aspergillus sclerotiicarbonarius CBS 121057]
MDSGPCLTVSIPPGDPAPPVRLIPRMGNRASNLSKLLYPPAPSPWSVARSHPNDPFRLACQPDSASWADHSR